MNASKRTAVCALGATLLSSAALAQTPTPLKTVLVANGFARPTYVGAPPGDEDRLFVLEQYTGAIRIIKNGTVLAQPFLTISGLSMGSEQGLLAMAFHPDYAETGYFYLMYTRTNNDTMVERYQVSASNPDRANPKSRTIILGPIFQPFTNHNGGTLAFGPNDGYLYLSLGDGGSGGDPACRAQNGQELLGKIIRIDVDGGTPYAIPPSNPFVANPLFRDEIWTFGWRNPWRLSFDRQTGDMYVGDVGQNTREEVSFQRGTSAGGENFGWKIMEGNNCFSTAACVNPPACGSPVLVRPIHDYATGAGGNCTVIGGYVYRGCGIPDLVGTYFFADYCSGNIWSFRFDGTTQTGFQSRRAELAPGGGLSIGRITSFGEDGRGEIYIVDQAGGEIFKIVANVPPAAVDLGFGVVGSSGKEPLFEVCGLLGPGMTAQFILRNAPASVPAAMLLSNQQNPTPTPWGTIVPLPVLATIPVFTDATGRIQFTVPGGLGPAVVYAQWAVADLGLPTSVGLSNALQITWP